MVVATRSRVLQGSDENSAHNIGAAPESSRIFRDELVATEIACNLMINYSYRVKKKSVSTRGSPEYCVQRKSGRRPGKQNLSSKRFRNASLLKGDDYGIGTSRASAHNSELVSPTFQQEVEANKNSIHSESQSTNPSSVQSTTPSSKVQILRRDFGASEVPKPSARLSTNPSSGQSITPPLKLKFGMYAGRVKANPLKYLASVLRSKLQPHFGACNLLEVATEIHNEAKNKHNTTLRRIYDVVNVLEAAGLLERSNGSTPRRLSRTQSKNESASSTSNTGAGSPSTEESTSAVEFEVELIESHGEHIKHYWRKRTILTEKPKPLEKKNPRGSRIRWLGSETEHEERCDRQTFGRLTEERIATVQRISEKQLELEYLQEELRLTTELIKQNQNGIYQSGCFESNTNGWTPPREDLSNSYLNFDNCSQTSAETECKPESVEFQQVIDSAAALGSSMMCGSSWSSLSRDFDSGPANLNIVTQEDLNFWYNQSMSEVEVNILEAAEQYQSNGLPLMNPRTAAKGLHTPFVILQTSNATNVDIELGADLTSEVHIVLDNEYKLFDYRELLSIMFPTHDRDGGFPSVSGL